MRADFAVGAAVPGAAQLRGGALQVAHAVQHPAQRVDDEIVRGRYLERLLDQLLRLGQARVAFRERVAERVVGVRVIGLHLDQPLQVGLEHVEAVQLLGGERVVVQQVGLVGALGERLAEQVEGLLVQVGLAQQLRFRDQQLNALRFALRAGGTQVGAPLREIALLGEHARDPHPGRQQVLAALDRLVPLERARPVLLLLRDLAQREAHCVRVPIAKLEQPFHVGFGDRILLRLEGEQPDRVDGVGVLRKAIQDRLELGARFRIALVEHQHARIAEPHVARLRILLKECFEARGGLGRRAPLQHLRLLHRHQFPFGTQHCRAPDLGQRERFVVRRRRGERYRHVRLREIRIALGEPAHHPQIGRQIRIARQPPAELHEAIGRRIAIDGEELGEVGFGLVDALGAHQQHGDGLQRLCGSRFGFLPDARRLQRDLRHAREVGHFDGATRDARVARAFCEIEVGLRREPGTAALRGDLAEQEIVQRLPGQVLQRQVGGRLLLSRGRCRGRRILVVVGFVVLLLCADSAQEDGCG